MATVSNTNIHAQEEKVLLAAEDEVLIVDSEDNWRRKRVLISSMGSGSIPGPQGEQGIQGDPGADGADGDNGAQGVQGVPGVDGVKGDTGERGLQGVTGLQGEQGVQGEQGLPGESYDPEDALIEWAQGKDYQPIIITRDVEGVITSMTIRWPDGSDGIFTSTDYNATHESYDGFTITHVDRSETVIQSAVTRDSEGGIINKPLLTIA